MMNKTVFSFLVIILATLALIPHIGLADKPRLPMSYKTNLEDGLHVFVMLTENKKPIINSAGVEYPKSGLYRNNSINPVYTVDWYAFEDNLVISNDGIYIAKVAPSIIDYKKGEAISFYSDGKLIKSYKISDLINDIDNLEQTVSHYIWRDCSIDDWTEDGEEAFMVNTIEETLPRGFYLETGKRKYFTVDDRVAREKKMKEQKIFDSPGMSEAYQRMLKEDNKNKFLKSSVFVGIILIAGVFFVYKGLKKK